MTTCPFCFSDRITGNHCRNCDTYTFIPSPFKSRRRDDLDPPPCDYEDSAHNPYESDGELLDLLGEPPDGL